MLDVGPNFGAINRAALIAADFVIVPVAPDLFSMQGLENVGPRLATWREQWRDRLDRAPDLDFEPPRGEMRPLGYAVSRHSVLAGGAAKAFQRWIDRMPDATRGRRRTGAGCADASGLVRLDRTRSVSSCLRGGISHPGRQTTDACRPWLLARLSGRGGVRRGHRQSVELTARGGAIA
jgi:hypothetical protein